MSYDNSESFEGEDDQLYDPFSLANLTQVFLPEIFENLTQNLEICEGNDVSEWFPGEENNVYDPFSLAYLTQVIRPDILEVDNSVDQTIHPSPPNHSSLSVIPDVILSPPTHFENEKQCPNHNLRKRFLASHHEQSDQPPTKRFKISNLESSIESPLKNFLSNPQPHFSRNPPTTVLPQPHSSTKPLPDSLQTLMSGRGAPAFKVISDERRHSKSSRPIRD